MLDRATVVNVAALARLELSEAEIERMAKDLGRITGYIDALADAGIDAKLLDAAVAHLAGEHKGNVWRDVERPSLKQEAFLANAPQSEAGYVKVPKIVE